MATPQRRSAPHLIDDLLRNPYYYEFHQGIKIIEALDPSLEPLGQSSFPAREILKIQAHITLSPSPSDIHKIAYKNEKYTVEINFMGLAGIQGPLPLPYTERILDRTRLRDYGLKEFLDLFNHRFLSLFHRIHKKNTVGLDLRPAAQIPMGQTIKGFTGFLVQNLSTILPQESLLAFGGLFWHQQKSKFAFQQILKSFFSLPVTVHPFQGRWVYLDDDQKTRIGFGGSFQILGQGASLGDKTWDQNAGIKIALGPMDYGKFQTFLKKREGYAQLMALCYAYLGGSQEFIVQLGIPKPQIPPLKLNGQNALGWTSWLRSGHPNSKPDFQVHLYPDS